MAAAQRRSDAPADGAHFASSTDWGTAPAHAWTKFTNYCLTSWLCIHIFMMLSDYTPCPPLSPEHAPERTESAGGRRGLTATTSRIGRCRSPLHHNPSTAQSQITSAMRRPNYPPLVTNQGPLNQTSKSPVLDFTSATIARLTPLSFA